MKTLIFIALAIFSVAKGTADPVSFYLKNAEAGQLVSYWILPGHSAKAEKEIVQDVALARGGRQMIAPFETRGLDLNDDELVLVVFVPWKQNLSFRSPVKAGFLLKSEVPSGKSVVLTEKNFSSFNQKREVNVALQDLGLLVPQFELDGEVEDWNKVIPLAEFGKSFQPLVRSQLNTDQTKAFKTLVEKSPKLVLFQASIFDRVLWLRIKADSARDFSWKGTTFQWTWAKRLLQAQMNAPSGPIWYFEPGKNPQNVGRYVTRGEETEFWIPLDRFTETERKTLLNSSIDFSRILELNNRGIETFYTSFLLQELP